jgi:transposase
MRYELTDHEWAAIKPMLPNKTRGVAREGVILYGKIDAAMHLLRNETSRNGCRFLSVSVELRRALPQRALKARPARSVRRLRNAGPISAPGVQMPPSPCTSRTRQRALSAIILLVEP